MKRITMVCAGLMISGAASAIQLPSSGAVAMNVCPPLNENVRINLSTGVVAGVTCSQTSVALSACHSTGKVTTRSVPVRTVAADATTGVPEHLENCTIDANDATCVLTPVTGPAMPAATTRLGTVNTQYPGGASCTVGGAESNSQVMNAAQ